MSQEPVDARYLYEQIYSELREEILAGTYKKGDWFPPERVLKDRFNTTHLTVRNALAKLVLEGYIERYSGKGTLVIYSREKAVTTRKPLRFPFAHVILPDLGEQNGFLLESLEAQLRKVPLAVRFSCHHGDVLLARSIYSEAVESGALVILQPAGQVTSLPGSEPFRNTILIRGSADVHACPHVVVDDAEGSSAAVRHLLDLGHRKIAFLAAAPVSSLQGLHRGFMDTLAARGVPADSGIIESCVPGAEGGARAARSIHGRDPECRAFLCASDETAAGAIHGLMKEGLAPGADCAVVGYGNTQLARGMRIASIDPCFELLSQRVVTSALDGMTRGELAEEVFHITPELRVRESASR